MKKSANKPQTVILVIAMLLALFTLITASAIISTEEKNRQEKASPTPTTTSESSPQDKATNRTYQSRLANISTAKAVDMFIAATVQQNKQGKLSRWNKKLISVSLRGQRTASDTACVKSALDDLNPVMTTSQFNFQKESIPADIEIYVLAPEQFTSVNIDAAPNNAGYLFSDLNHDFSYRNIDMLVSNRNPEFFRCLIVQHHILEAAGLHEPPTEITPADLDGKTDLSPVPYQAENIEMIRTLYSDYLISGLTEEEIRRRLLPQSN